MPFIKNKIAFQYWLAFKKIKNKNPTCLETEFHACTLALYQSAWSFIAAVYCQRHDFAAIFGGAFISKNNFKNYEFHFGGLFKKKFLAHHNPDGVVSELG